jgi:hypothetical protein
MITYRIGNLLEEPDLTHIAHQCNLYHNFGAGLAAQIAKKWPRALEWHKQSCGHEPYACQGHERTGELCAYCQALHLIETLSRRPQDQGGWQPISTAKKICDPAVMLADENSGEVWMDYWDEDLEAWANTGEYGLPAPTHWQPLPTPPAEKED